MNRRIKTLIICILISQLFFTAYGAPDWPSDTGIQANAGIVIDMDTGAVIFGQNIHVLYPPASITKLLTALIVLENSQLDEMVTFSKQAVYNVEEGSGNKLNVETGDKLSVEDCLYSLLLHSCNQAGNALAEHVAGSNEEFVRMMNDRIEELGCQLSHFDNPSGLNGDSQYVTAYDMSLIAKAAYSNEKLMEISSALSHEIPPTAYNPEGLTIYNTHRLVITRDSANEFYYPSAVAGKTGYLIKAGNTLVTYGEQDGKRLISVILRGSPRQYFIDGKTLLEFGFSRFDNIPVNGNETSYVSGEDPVEINGITYKPSDLELEPDCVITLPKGTQFSQADKTLVTELPNESPKGAVAMIQYTYNDRKVGKAFLIVKEDLKAANQESEQKNIEEPLESEINSDGIKKSSGNMGSNVFVIAGTLVFLAVSVGGTGFLIYRKRKESKEIALRKEERRRRLKEEGSEEEFEQLLQQRMMKR